MNFLEPATLEALTRLVVAVGGAITAIGGLIWSIRRKP
jgi:hypothetical protein